MIGGMGALRTLTGDGMVLSVKEALIRGLQVAGIRISGLAGYLVAYHLFGAVNYTWG